MNNIQMKRRIKGQGMTEYIIIVALIAIAAIASFTFFGDVVRGQVGTIASELGGQTGDTARAKVLSAANKADDKGSKHMTLKDYSQEGGADAASTN